MVTSDDKPILVVATDPLIVRHLHLQEDFDKHVLLPLSEGVLDDPDLVPPSYCPQAVDALKARPKVNEENYQDIPSLGDDHANALHAPVRPQEAPSDPATDHSQTPG